MDQSDNGTEADKIIRGVGQVQLDPHPRGIFMIDSQSASNIDCISVLTLPISLAQ